MIDLQGIAKSREIPSIAHLPFMGNLLDLRRDRLGLYVRVNRECGAIGKFYLGSQPVIMVNRPDYVATILRDHDRACEKSPTLRQFLHPLLGDGILTTDQESHPRQRRLVASAFHHQHLPRYAEIMAGYAERLCQRWQPGMQIDIAQEMHGLSLQIVSKTLFGVQQDTNTVSDAIMAAQHYTNLQVTSPLPLPYTWPTPRNRRFRRALEQLDRIVYAMITERRTSGDNTGDFLSMLLVAQDEGSGMTDKQVRDEAMTLFLAGHETIAEGLAWTWYLLTQHPDIYTRMQAEVSQVLGGRTPTLDDLPKLPYTLQVLKESLRLYPPVHTIGRQVVKPFVVDGYTFNEGDIIGMSWYVIHRQPDIFSEPERFDPERFAPWAEQLIPRGAYQPFSFGSRNCIGQHFAMMEGHLVLATLAQHVTFELLPDQRIVPQALITLRPYPGIRMVIR